MNRGEWAIVVLGLAGTFLMPWPSEARAPYIAAHVHQAADVKSLDAVRHGEVEIVSWRLFSRRGEAGRCVRPD
jgi:hypothetical protein